MQTVSDVMRSVFRGTGFKCLLHEKRNLDDDPHSEYADVDQRIRGKIHEYPRLDHVKEVMIQGLDEKTPTPLTYFMDGSRRVFRFSDIILNDGRYFPVLAGQVGVAVLGRNADGSMTPQRDYCKYQNLLIFPDTVEQPDREAVRKGVQKAMGSRKCEFIIDDYQTGSSGGNASEDYINKGTKKILDRMHDLELGAIVRMMENRMLSGDRMLVIDGSLQFRREVLNRLGIPITEIALQLVNVIGISKSFTPSQPVSGMTKGRHLGAILQDMEFGHRTPVFRAGEDVFTDTLGVWYLRIRDRKAMTSPLEGVIKVECLARNQRERDNGIDADRVDTISAYILSERSVTPYGSDNRWANHLYPIFLTESYLKSGFRSDTEFKGLL